MTTKVYELEAVMSTPYSYIQHHYGLTFNVGDRVEFTEGKRQPGTVMRPKLSSEHYVNVKFDAGHHGMCHPRSLEIVPATGE